MLAYDRGCIENLYLDFEPEAFERRKEVFLPRAFDAAEDFVVAETVGARLREADVALVVLCRQVRLGRGCSTSSSSSSSSSSSPPFPPFSLLLSFSFSFSFLLLLRVGLLESVKSITRSLPRVPHITADDETTCAAASYNPVKDHWGAAVEVEVQAHDPAGSGCWGARTNVSEMGHVVYGVEVERKLHGEQHPAAS